MSYVKKQTQKDREMPKLRVNSFQHPITYTMRQQTLVQTHKGQALFVKNWNCHPSCPLTLIFPLDYISDQFIPQFLMSHVQDFLCRLKSMDRRGTSKIHHRLHFCWEQRSSDQFQQCSQIITLHMPRGIPEAEYCPFQELGFFSKCKNNTFASCMHAC